MSHCLTNLWRPAAYHGRGKTRNYFEGWYYKVVDPTGAHRYAFIPGVFLGPTGEESHAFVQWLNGVTGETRYLRYPLTAFDASRCELNVRVGGNHFFANRMVLDIGATDLRIEGELRFRNLTPWPVTPLSPGVMGPFAFVPRMETYHGVLSMDHTIEGWLNINGEPTDFWDGRGYMEKDWGRSFPHGWVWVQSNHFADSPGTSLSASVALIPWVNRTFRGFIVGLWHGGRLYRFATYTGARILRLAVDDERVEWSMADGRHRLSIVVQRATPGMLLHMPTGTEMVPRVPETMSATVVVRLVALGRNERVLFQGTGAYAGLETGGEVHTIADVHT
ncbi:MAG: tocopherol cyclase family protein [Anaerolineae bacterium]